MISIEDLDKIIEIVEKHTVSRFEFQQDNSKVIIERESSIKEALKEDNSIAETINKEIHIEENNNEKNDIKKTYIKASLAGTVYLRKEEGEEPFVKLHDKVEENTVIGLIEVMKLFNEVEAGVSGEIINILVKDGDFVEYGQPLFEIKPN